MLWSIMEDAAGQLGKWANNRMLQATSVMLACIFVHVRFSKGYGRTTIANLAWRTKHPPKAYAVVGLSAMGL